MRTNLAISPDASFKTSPRWAKASLPLSLHWRSQQWRLTVPALWGMIWALWIGVVSVETPEVGLIFYALFFIGLPAVLALSAAWWVTKLLHHRHRGTFVIETDYLEWQFETESDVDLLADCTRFEFIGGRSARLRWALTEPEAMEGWLGRPWATLRGRCDPLRPDRVIYGADVGLDPDDLASLCKLLNQLRDEALASR